MERYQVGDLMIDVPSGAVTRGSRRLPLPRLTFNLLVALVRRAPAVVNRRELLDTVWTGCVVSDAALSQRVSLLRQALGEGRERDGYIAAARGWGYSITQPVDRIKLKSERVSSLAIAPFVSLSRTVEETAFAAALSQSLIAVLSKMKSVEVVVLPFAGLRRGEQRVVLTAPVAPAQAALQGSILRSGERVWVSAQLLRVASGSTLWAQTYRRDVGDVTLLVDELAATMAQGVCSAAGIEARG